VKNKSQLIVSKFKFLVTGKVRTFHFSTFVKKRAIQNGIICHLQILNLILIMLVGSFSVLHTILNVFHINPNTTY